MQAVLLPSYGTMGVNDQLVTTPPMNVFNPSRALGPTFATYGTTPLATLPGMPMGNPSDVTSPSGRISLWVGIGLAISLVVGVWLMSNVHYR